MKEPGSTRKNLPKRSPFITRLWRKAEVAVGGPAILVAILTVIALLVGSGLTVFLSERNVNANASSLGSSFGWVALTLLFDPPWDVVSIPGKYAYYTMLLLQPGSIAVLTAAMTSKFFQLLARKGSGMGQTRLADHIVVCGWSGKGTEILKEIRGRRDDESRRPVVILAALKANPSRDELTTFISGDPTEERDLRRVGIPRARTAIVLADNSYPDIDAEEMDSRTLLTTLAVESLNPDCYTCVEVVHSSNKEHFNRTKADELVVSAHLTGALLANSAITHGLSRIVGDLITFPVGNEFYWVDLPPQMVGIPFKDILLQMKERHDCLPIAIESAADGRHVTNPDGGLVLSEGDRILVIADRDPFAKGVRSAKGPAGNGSKEPRSMAADAQRRSRWSRLFGGG